MIHLSQFSIRRTDLASKCFKIDLASKSFECLNRNLSLTKRNTLGIFKFFCFSILCSYLPHAGFSCLVLLKPWGYWGHFGLIETMGLLRPTIEGIGFSHNIHWGSASCWRKFSQCNLEDQSLARKHFKSTSIVCGVDFCTEKVLCFGFCCTCSYGPWLCKGVWNIEGIHNIKSYLYFTYL